VTVDDTSLYVVSTTPSLPLNHSTSMVNNTEPASGDGKPSADSTTGIGGAPGVSIPQATNHQTLADRMASSRKCQRYGDDAFVPLPCSSPPGALKRSSSKAGDQLREILRWWLSPLDQSANHTAAGKARRSGAAEWLTTQRGVYEEWKKAVQGKQ